MSGMGGSVGVALLAGTAKARKAAVVRLSCTNSACSMYKRRITVCSSYQPGYDVAYTQRGRGGENTSLFRKLAERESIGQSAS